MPKTAAIVLSGLDFHILDEVLVQTGMTDTSGLLEGLETTTRINVE
jgi:hypothetical protein